MRRFVTAVSAGAAAAAVVMALLPGPMSGIGAVWAAPWAAASGPAGGEGCDHDGMRTALRTAFDPAQGYTVVAVIVDGIDARCAGHRLSVALTDGPGTVSTQGGPVLVAAEAGPVTVMVTPVAVAAAAKVHTLLD